MKFDVLVVGGVGDARCEEEGGEQRAHEGKFHPVLQGTTGFKNGGAQKRPAIA